MPFDGMPYTLNSVRDIVPGVNGLALNQNALCAQDVEQAYAFFNELGPYATDLGPKQRHAKAAGSAWRPNPTAAGFGVKLAGATGYFAAIGHQLRPWSRECLFVYGASGAQMISTIQESPGAGSKDRVLYADASSKLSCDIYDGITKKVAATTTLVVGQVYHALVAVSNSVMKIYLNGVEEGSIAVNNAGHQGYSTPEMIFGYSSSASHGPGTANTLFWHIEYNRELTAPEARHRYLNQMEMFALADERQVAGIAAGGDTILSPGNLTHGLGVETPVVLQAHILSGAKAAFAFGSETPALAQAHGLTAADLHVADYFENTGFLQAHGLFAQKLNFAVPFDGALLVMNAQKAPGFRTYESANNLREEIPVRDARGAPVAAQNRLTTIME